MLKFIILILCFCSTVLNAQLQNLDPKPPNLQPEDPELEATIRRFNYFDLELLQEFSDVEDNVFISPASIKTTLAMILEGAKGKCAIEIGNALRIDNIDRQEIRSQLERLLFDLYDKSPSIQLQTANAVFVSNQLKILSKYQMKLAEYYRATVLTLDFTKPDQAAKMINYWASNATHGEINQITDEQSLTADSTLIIANALFFKAKWKKSFETEHTKVKCFQSTKGCINTNMMQLQDTFNYNLITDLNAHALELPYQEKYSMLLLIPSVGNNIRVLIRDMQHAHFATILDSLKPEEILFEMPRFSIEYSADLVKYLKPLKIQEVFGPEANLSGIVTKDNVRINNIVHQTKIKVDENGTIAAAATSAVVIPLMGSEAFRVAADKPFIFFIYQTISRNIIFEGILMKPDEVIVQPSLKSSPQSGQTFPPRGPFPSKLQPPQPGNQFQETQHRSSGQNKRFFGRR